MKIAVISTKINQIAEEMMELLAKMGAEVRWICPEKQVTDLTKVRVEDDLYVIKSVGHLGLGLAGALHAAGAKTLNPYPAVALVKHKVIVTQMLHSAGVPVPETYTSTDPTVFRPMLDVHPLIAKPFDGSRGAGISIIRTPDQLTDIEFGEFLMVQRYCEPDEPGRFIKAYFLDGQVFLTKRWWSIETHGDKRSEPIEPTDVLTTLVSNCAKVLGLKLFGLDIVVSDGNPYIVDVQEFGSFAGVPNAPALLADFTISYLGSL